MFIAAIIYALLAIVSLIEGGFIVALESVSGGAAMFALGSVISEFNEVNVGTSPVSKLFGSEKPVFPTISKSADAPEYKAKHESPSNSSAFDQDRYMNKGGSASGAYAGGNDYDRAGDHLNRADVYVKRESASVNRDDAYVNKVSDYADIADKKAYSDVTAERVNDDYLMNEGTMLLDGDQMIPLAKLVRLRDQKPVRITKKQFTIGKAKEGIDYCVDGNPAVSRRHAEIVFRDGGFYIVDTNSTNHVYVDDRMIPPGMPVRITDGTRIRLGNEMFQFSEG